VEFYAQYGQDSPVTLFFCKRVDGGLDWRPYDLEVVKREAAGDDCYTISASGVMHMRKGVRAGVCKLVILKHNLSHKAPVNDIRIPSFYALLPNH
jgi:hypothetical protein